MPEAPPFAFDRVQAEKSMIMPLSVPSAPMPLPRSLRPRPRKTPVLLSLMTLNVATCMWTAVLSLLSKTLLENVAGMLFEGNFEAPFSVACYVRTPVSSNCRTISQS